MKKIIIFLCSIMLIIQSSIVYGATKDLMELDEKSESTFNILSELTNINCLLPFRSSTTVDKPVDVNGPYNEPRPAAKFYGTHRGVDLVPVSPSLGEGVKLFPVYDNGVIKSIVNSLNAAYGRNLTVQYTYTTGGKTYTFQSFYAHMKKTTTTDNLVLGSNAAKTVSVGEMGKSGSTEEQYSAHLHLEMRGATSGGTSTTNCPTTRRYPPNFFFPNSANSLDMSYINRTYASKDKVTFRIYLKDLAGYQTIPLGAVKFYYQADGNINPDGNWQTATVTVANSKEFSINLTNLYTNKIVYYVDVYDDTWATGQYYRVYRPYRYTDAAPTDRPFVQEKSTALSDNYDLLYMENYNNYCTVIDNVDMIENYSQNIENSDKIRVIGDITYISNDFDYIIIKNSEGVEQTIKLSDKNEFGPKIEVGMTIKAGCTYKDQVYYTDGMSYMIINSK